MTLLKTVLRETIGLFVDDGLLALAILAVVGLGAWALNDSRLGEAAAAGALVGGCLAVLALSVVRAAYATRASRERASGRAKVAIDLHAREGKP
jgi:hypothetical protein